MNENRLKEVVDFVKNEDINFVSVYFYSSYLETHDRESSYQSIGGDYWQASLCKLSQASI